MIRQGIEYGCLAKMLRGNVSAADLVDRGIQASSAMFHAIQDCGETNNPGELPGAEEYCQGCPAKTEVPVGQALQDLAARVGKRLDLDIL